jgi:hypothetical protein
MAFIIRNVKGIEMRDIEVKPSKPDMRPGFVMDDVEGAELIHIKLPRSSEVPSIVLKDVKNLSIAQSRPVGDTQLESVEQKTL